MPINEQDPEALAETFVDVISRLGELGIGGYDALVDKVNEMGDSNVDFSEGMARLESLLA